MEVQALQISEYGLRFRRSMQHLFAVYSQEFQIPAFFLGVDSGAARSGRGAPVSEPIGRFLSGDEGYTTGTRKTGAY